MYTSHRRFPNVRAAGWLAEEVAVPRSKGSGRLHLKNILFGAVASIAVALAPTPAMAQSGPDDTDTVVVWGQLEEGLAQELADYGSRLEVITAADIKRGGFNDA